MNQAVSPFHRRAVLLVDDDDVLVRGLTRGFRELGFVAYRATGPVDAVKLASEHRIDLAVVDLMLHDSFGIEVVEALRRVRARIRIVLYSGFARVSWVDELAQRQDLRCVDKPTTPQKLLAALDVAL